MLSFRPTTGFMRARASIVLLGFSALVGISGCSLFESVEVVAGSDASTPTDSDTANEDAVNGHDADPTDLGTSSDAAQDAGDGGDASDAADAGAVGCTCRDENLVCEEFACVLPESDCSQDPESCPTHFGCFDGSRCACGSEIVCGIQCSTQADCPVDQICIPEVGVCTYTFGCLDDRTCPEETRCIFRTDRQSLTGSCKKVGNLADGNPCSLDEECAGGLCVLSVCASPCRAGFDCAPDQECVLDDRFEERICLGSDVGCTCNDEEFCSRDRACITNDRCYPDRCNDAQICSLSSGKCLEESATPCQLGEVLIEAETGETICLDPAARCTEDADCAGSQRCLYAESQRYQPFDEILGFWSQAVAACGRFTL